MAQKDANKEEKGMSKGTRRFLISTFGISILATIGLENSEEILPILSRILDTISPFLFFLLKVVGVWIVIMFICGMILSIFDESSYDPFDDM